MKSKLLKLKEKTAKEWCFFFCKSVCMAAACYAIVVGKYIEASFALAVLGWYNAAKELKVARAVIDDVSKANDRLIVVNKELNDLYNDELSLAQGLISENKDLKFKLKNAKMEASRLRNKGGNRHE